MAVGFSGSNGGIGNNEKIFLDGSLEVSYFINNKCNLSCRHCYVGYENAENELKPEEWRKTFDELLDRGALTFGNVGKEPLLSWDKTLNILKYFKEKKNINQKIRFGIVTNATLFDKNKINELSEINPDYVDISVDGNQKIHDYIRGNGNYKKTYDNLLRIGTIAPSLLEKIYISYTLMEINKNSIEETIENLNNIGINKFLISPYVGTESVDENKKELKKELIISEDEVALIYDKIKHGQIKVKGSEILLKSDYETTKYLIEILVNKEIIEVNNLLIDDYGVIFNKFTTPKEKSTIILNYILVPQTFTKAIRISHDGYVSGCHEMFYGDYTKLAKGNIKEKSINAILNE